MEVLLSVGATLATMVALGFGAAKLVDRIVPAPRRLSREEELVARLSMLARRIAQSRAAIAEKNELIGELDLLRAKMRQLDTALYQSRIEKLSGGIGLLQRQIRLERDLLQEYERAYRMLDVEVESSRVAGHFDGEAVDGVAARLDELEAIRQANSELQLQLEANEEIERYLAAGPAERGPTGDR